MNKQTHKQHDLFGNAPDKKTRAPLSDIERRKRQEYTEAYRLFKLLKSNKFHSFSDNDKVLLKMHYNIIL